MGAEHYLAIDIGGTKTLFAVFDKAGEMVCEKKIETNHDLDGFKKDLRNEIGDLLKQFRISYCCCALPGWIDFDKGIAVGFGNLPWENVPIVQELESMAPGVRIMVNNDAKLAGLSEARLLGDKYKKVLYLTISTGIGGGVISDGQINPDFKNFEPGQMVFEYQGQTKQWEDIASGRTLKANSGKLASEIEDPAIWRDYVKNLVLGFEDLLATVQPDVVVIGGGVGAHFEKFKDYLEGELQSINNPLVPIPPLLKAQRPEEAVIYGCYDYIKQNIE
jgi:predicted NBD/HSP70 family sugar kinase